MIFAAPGLDIEQPPVLREILEQRWIGDCVVWIQSAVKSSESDPSGPDAPAPI